MWQRWYQTRFFKAQFPGSQGFYSLYWVDSELQEIRSPPKLNGEGREKEAKEDGVRWKKKDGSECIWDARVCALQPPPSVSEGAHECGPVSGQRHSLCPHCSPDCSSLPLHTSYFFCFIFFYVTRSLLLSLILRL